MGFITKREFHQLVELQEKLVLDKDSQGTPLTTAARVAMAWELGPRLARLARLARGQQSGDLRFHRKK